MRKLFCFAVAILFALPQAGAAPMKARVIQPLFAQDEAGLDKSFEWTIHELRRCDSSLDIVVLPEFSEVPGKTSNAGFLETVRRYGPTLLEECARTAQRCSTLVFCGAIDTSWDIPRNATFVFGRDGSLLGKFYKQHLTAGEWQKYGLDKSYTEQWRVPTYMDIEGVRYMFLTCYDFYFYEHYANMARWKPDVVIGCSHQRSDPHHVLDMIDQFCAYHTGAYLVRASVSMGKKAKNGGCSCVVGPDGKILGNLYSRIATLDVSFDPSKKYLKPAGYGNPPAMHSDYIEIGRRPWVYRPGGSAIVPPLSEQPAGRSVYFSNDIAELGAAVASGVQEIAFELESGAAWEEKLTRILSKLSCHAVMNIRLKGQWGPDQRKKVEDLVFAYDADKYVYYTDAADVTHYELPGNPLITHMYSADPSAHVFGDSLYLYPSHDRDKAHGFDMEDYHCYVTADMKTFEDRGVIFRPFEQTTWAKSEAWAPDCVERNGKYYFYFPTDKRNIGVVVGDTPYGPFSDPLGRPLLTIDSPGVVCNRDFIDPCVFIDDDGQAYMFVGQNTCCCIKLNDDMVSYDGEVHIIEGLEEFFEASWVHKYNGKYYLSYSNSPFTGHRPEIVYAVSDNPLGPYEYKGMILGPVSSGTNHHSIVRFGDDWFLFYHTGDLARFNWPDNPGLAGSRRSVCVDRLYYNPDGTIQPVVPTVSKERLENNSAYKGNE